VPAETLLLRRTLSLLRRRQRLVTLVETGLAAVIVIGAAAVPLAVSLAPGIAMPLIILVACVAAVAVVIVAIVRTPVPGRIAALADARLHLEDRLVTALQYADDPDAVSRLVVRDATSRVAGESPARVFPFRVPAWIGWTAAVALTTSAALTLAAGKLPSGIVRRSAVSSGAGVAGAPAAPNAAVHAGDAASPDPTGRQQASVNVGPAPARDPGTTQGADDPAKTPGSRAETSAVHAPEREAGRAQVAVAIPVPLTQAPDAVAPLASRATSPSTDLGSAGGVASRGQAAASSAGGLPSRGTPSGSGGAPRTANAVQAGTRPDTHDARYAAARARAEAALASERIPPGLRAYLTAYFTAIGRDGGRTER
jgi:hypothetical protein